MDKLDVINRKTAMHSHLVKWWDVNMLPADADLKKNSGLSEEERIPDLDELEGNDLSAVERILRENSNQNAFNKAYTVVENEERNARLAAEQEANEIYERLMREAEEDEAKKQAEIEAAKLLAE